GDLMVRMGGGDDAEGVGSLGGFGDRTEGTGGIFVGDLFRHGRIKIINAGERDRAGRGGGELRVDARVFLPEGPGSNHSHSQRRWHAACITVRWDGEQKFSRGARLFVLDELELDLGVIGPEALGEKTQTWWSSEGKQGLPDGCSRQFS